MLTLNSAYHYLCSVIQTKLGRNPLFHPLLTTFEITYRCNLRCHYCSDGSGVKCPDLKCPELTTPEIIRLLEIIRPVNDILGITGGEPTLRPDLVEVLRAAKRVGFKIVLNTNAVLFHQHPDIAQQADEIITSLESLDTRLLARLWQCKPETAAQTVANIERMAGLQQEKRFRLAIQSLINHETLSHTREVMAFCRDRRIVFSPSPEVTGISIRNELRNDPAFQDLLRYIRQRKTQGDAIMTTFGFLDLLIEGKGFRCVPSANPRIRPNGDLFYPCFPLKQIAGNLLQIGDYRRALAQGYRRYGRPPECRDRCQFNCIIDFAEIVRHPSRVLQELWLAARAR